MLPTRIHKSGDIALLLAQRVKSLRLNREWTQHEMAARAGITLATYQRFERTGRISLERLLELAAVLDARSGFESLFADPKPRSLNELERMDVRRRRRRGKRSDAKT